MPAAGTSGGWVRAGWRTAVAWSAVASVVGCGHAGIKLCGAVTLLVLLIATYREHEPLISRITVGLGAAAWFALALLISPYWGVSTLTVSAATAWCGVLCAGVLWTACAARPIAPPRGIPVGLPVLGVPALAIVVLLWPGLSASLAWRGDEDSNLARIWSLLDAWKRVPWSGWQPWCWVLAGVAVINPGRRLGVALRVVLLGGCLTILAVSMKDANAAGQLDVPLRRYPFVLVWLQAALSWSVARGFEALRSDPAAARLLPALAVAGIAVWAALGIGATEASRQRAAAAAVSAAALALATCPVLLFYGALIYADLPLIAILVWVCAAGDRLMRSQLLGLPVGAAWLGLLVVPFLKETAVGFVVAFLGCAAAFGMVQRLRRVAPGSAMLLRGLQLAVVLLLPIAVYLYVRDQGPAVRHAFRFDATQFAEPGLYAVLARAMVEQFGVVLPLAGIGALRMLRRRPWLVLLCITVGLTYVLLFCGDGQRRVRVDGAVLPGYLGYSRFMLYGLPPLLVLAVHGLRGIARRGPGWLGAVALLCLAANAWMCPLRADGSRVAGWGDYIIDTQDHQYPYAALYAWMASQSPSPSARVAVIGRRYGYAVGDTLYIRRYGLPVTVREYLLEVDSKLRVGQAAGPPDRLRTAFDEAMRDRPDYIVIHQPVWGPPWDGSQQVAAYRRHAEFLSGGLRLVVYYRGQSDKADCGPAGSFR